MPKGIYNRAEAKARKLASVEQLDGKLREEITPATARAPRTLDEIMGIQETSQYTTSDPEQYKAYIDDLNNTDLWRHANAVGLAQSHDLPKLKRDLIREHATYFRTKPSIGGQERRTIITEKDLSVEVKKILAEGR